MTQEALKTQIDWETNHLDSENKKLRDSSAKNRGLLILRMNYQ